jgi:hypothetical protein
MCFFFVLFFRSLIVRDFHVVVVDYYPQLSETIFYIYASQKKKIVHVVLS